MIVSSWMPVFGYERILVIVMTAETLMKGSNRQIVFHKIKAYRGDKR